MEAALAAAHEALKRDECILQDKMERIRSLEEAGAKMAMSGLMPPQSPLGDKPAAVAIGQTTLRCAHLACTYLFFGLYYPIASRKTIYIYIVNIDINNPLTQVQPGERPHRRAADGGPTFCHGAGCAQPRPYSRLPVCEFAYLFYALYNYFLHLEPLLTAYRLEDADEVKFHSSSDGRWSWWDIWE